MSKTRPAAVAGMFYPAERARFAADVDALLSTAAQSQQTAAAPKAIIAPHAGYVYSGAVAASAYAHLRKARNVIRRVVLLGPVHRVPVRGLALPGSEAFETPLGRVPIDLAAIESYAIFRKSSKAPRYTSMSIPWKCICHSCNACSRTSRSCR